MAENEKKCIDEYVKTPLFVGVIIGALAAIMQGLLISAGGPEAYGFCVACHTRDFVNWVVNGVAGTKLAIAPISANSVLPVLTVIGVLIGAFITSKYYGEFRVKTGTPVDYLKYVIGGFIFMIFALFIAGCPYRIALNIAYGNVIALVGVIAIIFGVFAGAKIAVKIAEKEG